MRDENAKRHKNASFWKILVLLQFSHGHVGKKFFIVVGWVATNPPFRRLFENRSSGVRKGFRLPPPPSGVWGAGLDGVGL